LAVAVIAIALGERLPWLVARAVPGHRHGALAAVLMAAVGAYGGYFGAGMGFMLVAVLTVAGAGGIHTANAEKNLAAFCINTTAAVPLLASGLVSLPAAGLVAAGGLVGGWCGAQLARRVPARPMRLGVALTGLALTVSFLLR
ncbi:MAG: sulfite exporter TauE/SafE family protein, partial [Rhodobacteraceae bacterium]|nr:sulfite exporter TauE/SafE family protein [Paracoccaceae bacterium]